MNLQNYFNNFSTLPRENLPEIELYIDQVTSFLDEKLNCYKRNESETALTKTMVNNYTRAKLLPTSVKKKYSNIHMIYLILIYHLKSALSIDDISKVLGFDKENPKIIEDLYNDFLILQNNNLNEFSKSFEKDIIEIKQLPNKKSIDDETLLILKLVLEIEIRKLTLEKIIDNSFLDKDDLN